MNDVTIDNYFRKSIKREDKDNTVKESKNTMNKLKANGAVSKVSEFIRILKDLTNAAWGSNWGLLSSDISKGGDGKRIQVPQITVSLNLREKSEGESNKPRLTDTKFEQVDQIETGDIFRVYRQKFDCIFEFNIWGETSLDCEELQEKFEELLLVYTGYLKQRGVSEIFFLKEVPANYSLKFDKTHDGAMKCLYYYVRLERARKVRIEDIKEISLRLESYSD